jgi:hypothetical protein
MYHPAPLDWIIRARPVANLQKSEHPHETSSGCGSGMGIRAKPAAERQRNGHPRKTSRGAAEEWALAQNQPRSGRGMGIGAKPAAEQQRNGHWRKTSRGAAEDSSRGRQPPERPAVPISPGGATEILARTADIQSERPRSALCHRYTPRAVTPGSRMADLLGPITIRAAAYFAFFRYGTPLVIHSGAGLPFR